MSNFQYVERWPAIAQGLDPATVTSLEAHDRELEQYLYAPPRAWAPKLWGDALTAPVDDSAGWSVAGARWERLRGRFCTASIVATRVGSAVTGIVGIALPDDAAPAPPLPGIPQAPVGGIAMRMRYANTLPPSREFVALRAYDQRSNGAGWLVIFAASNPGGGGFPQMVTQDFDPGQLDVLVTTFMWRTA